MAHTLPPFSNFYKTILVWSWNILNWATGNSIQLTANIMTITMSFADTDPKQQQCSHVQYSLCIIFSERGLLVHPKYRTGQRKSTGQYVVGFTHPDTVPTSWSPSLSVHCARTNYEDELNLCSIEVMSENFLWEVCLSRERSYNNLDRIPVNSTGA